MKKLFHLLFILTLLLVIHIDCKAQDKTEYHLQLASTENATIFSHEIISNPEGKQIIKSDDGNSGKFPLEICLTCPSYDYFITPASVWQTHSSSIVSNGCRIYIVYVAQGNTYAFKTGCENRADSEFDTNLELYFGDCNTPGATDDDGCPPTQSTFTSWTVFENIPWVAAFPFNGIGNGTLNFEYSENTFLTPRSGQISLLVTLY